LSRERPELPVGWEWCVLEDVAEVRLGRQRSPKNHQGENMVPYIRAANVTWEGLDLTDVKEMNFTEEEVERYALKPGDILLSEASGSASEVGKPAIWRGELNVCCFQNTLIRVRSEHPLPEYLLLVLREAALSGKFAQTALGVGIHHLGAARLSMWPIALPPAEEQGRIVEAVERSFGEISAADAELEAALAEAQQLQRSVYSSAYADEWPLVALKDVLREKPRNGHSAKAAPGGGVRTLTLTAVTLSEFSDENTKMTNADPAKVNDLWLEPGDILVQRSNTPELVGSAALYRGKRQWAIFPDLLIRLRTNNEILPEFLNFVLQSHEARSYFRSSARGTAGSMPKINQGIIEGLRVPRPSLEEQENFLAAAIEQLEAYASLTSELVEAAILSKALRHTVLHRATTGALIRPSEWQTSALEVLAAIESARAEPQVGKHASKKRHEARTGAYS
jgi:type I restriction enzyme S subunit